MGSSILGPLRALPSSLLSLTLLLAPVAVQGGTAVLWLALMNTLSDPPVRETRSAPLLPWLCETFSKHTMLSNKSCQRRGYLSLLSTALRDREHCCAAASDGTAQQGALSLSQSTEIRAEITDVLTGITDALLLQQKHFQVDSEPAARCHAIWVVPRMAPVIRTSEKWVVGTVSPGSLSGALLCQMLYAVQPCGAGQFPNLLRSIALLNAKNLSSDLLLSECRINTPEEGLRPVSSCAQRGRAARGRGAARCLLPACPGAPGSAPQLCALLLYPKAGKLSISHMASPRCVPDLLGSHQPLLGPAEPFGSRPAAAGHASARRRAQGMPQTRRPGGHLWVTAAQEPGEPSCPVLPTTPPPCPAALTPLAPRRASATGTEGSRERPGGTGIKGGAARNLRFQLSSQHLHGAGFGCRFLEKEEQAPVGSHRGTLSGAGSGQAHPQRFPTDSPPLSGCAHGRVLFALLLAPPDTEQLKALGYLLGESGALGLCILGLDNPSLLSALDLRAHNPDQSAQKSPEPQG
ncbi:hypothetical protein Anapl_10949 [Anas platyrhynchos]|uniref:Uncharacterized protein n=1 Tax=Anas platyrhynchos TaxID=8839 RepID=R0JUA3_ANAPL|nr:hypothetical protein Anapl_10949 [Anas platyrhynchos]